RPYDTCARPDIDTRASKAWDMLEPEPARIRLTARQAIARTVVTITKSGGRCLANPLTVS
ncbi:MAG: hypothetical protein VB144_13115, partial [Clostridia bacterium]|nr:hypothetical protein [Clostridia bacterium]